MNVLVINCGSSSLKYQLFDMPGEKVLAKGLVERIGEPGDGGYIYEANGACLKGETDAADHEAAVAFMVEWLTHTEHGPIDSIDEIDAVGHRVVHGGEVFIDSAAIDDEVITAVEEQVPLAPLHNPANLVGIRAARKILPKVTHVAVFDTSFHETMPPHAYHYAIPREFYEEHHVRRYGFHGTSHRFVARRAAKMLGKSLSEFTGITCHLGNGCSMAAVKNGKSVDTTMGLTPLEGLVMGTRSGDIDPGAAMFIARTDGLDFGGLDMLLNKKSGLLGLSGLSNDVRTLLEARSEGNEHAALALDVFAYRVRKYIGAYLAVLNGADAIVFTGGIGENATRVREDICTGLEALGVELDRDKNTKTQGCEATVSTPESRVRILIVPTNEELEIANETVRIAGG